MQAFGYFHTLPRNYFSSRKFLQKSPLAKIPSRKNLLSRKFLIANMQSEPVLQPRSMRYALNVCYVVINTSHIFNGCSTHLRRGTFPGVERDVNGPPELLRPNTRP